MKAPVVLFWNLLSVFPRREKKNLHCCILGVSKIPPGILHIRTIVTNNNNILSVLKCALKRVHCTQTLPDMEEMFLINPRLKKDKDHNNFHSTSSPADPGLKFNIMIAPPS